MNPNELEFRFYVPYFYAWLADHWHEITSTEELRSFRQTPLRLTYKEVDVTKDGRSA